MSNRRSNGSSDSAAATALSGSLVVFRISKDSKDRMRGRTEISVSTFEDGTGFLFPTSEQCFMQVSTASPGSWIRSGFQILRCVLRNNAGRQQVRIWREVDANEEQSLYQRKGCVMTRKMPKISRIISAGMSLIVVRS
ncbi:hypothetical protein B0H12DRAFT_1143454 [Mycena haematopus]|nr:hypothetical protein B0H12DRAFT_1143454 [Mycena haematopus]